MTPLTENLYCIEVPDSAKNVKISSLNNLYEYGDFGIKNILYELPIDDKFQLLGTVTKDEVSFDCEPYVERSSVGYGYISYIIDTYFYTPEPSFRSLIEHKTGKLFVNPKPHPSDIGCTDLRQYSKLKTEWCKQEINLLKKLVIIKKV